MSNQTLGFHFQTQFFGGVQIRKTPDPIIHISSVVNACPTPFLGMFNGLRVVTDPHCTKTTTRIKRWKRKGLGRQDKIKTKTIHLPTAYLLKEHDTLVVNPAFEAKMKQLIAQKRIEDAKGLF
jgi:hypothetical protein